jgi:hypothetical protein
MPDIKQRLNRMKYIEILRSMTPEQRWMKSFELTEHARALFEAGLRQRHPELPDAELKQLMIKRLARCHNRNW